MRLPRLPSTPTAARALGLALMLLAPGALLAACGGSGPVAANAAAKERAQERKNEIRVQEFAKCLREHGIDAQFSTTSGASALRVGAAKKISRQAFEAVQSACRRYRPEPKAIHLSPQQQVEMEERVRRFAKCMREHGIDIEVQTSGDRGAVKIGQPGGGGPNAESPAFQHAQNACQGLLPRPGGGQKGGPLGVQIPDAGRPPGAPQGGGPSETGSAGG
jgi:hypothetical protein